MKNRNAKTAQDQLTLQTAFEKVITGAVARLAKNERVRRTLPGEGRLKFDRQLPFLCVYRWPLEQADDGTCELVTTEAAYLFASSDPQYYDGLTRLCRAINSAMQEHFGTFLFIEIWADEELSNGTDDGRAPAFEIVSAELAAIPSTLKVFQRALSGIRVRGHQAVVTQRSAAATGPPGIDPIADGCSGAATAGCCTIGLAVKPIYRDTRTGVVYPLVLQELRAQLAKALRKAVAGFTGSESNTEALHYETLGPTSLVKAARLIDQQLCEVSESFDFLLQVTPINADEAEELFKQSGARDLPLLRYRPLPYHPNLLKRRLFNIEIERVEDPTLAHLFWEKQDEIDRQLTALRDLNLPEVISQHTQQANFLNTSLQLYGAPEEALVELAADILKYVPAPRARRGKALAWVNSKQLVDRAHEEIDHYRTQMPEFNATVEISSQIAAGIMVSHDRLLIADDIKLSPRRVEPLLHHEIGTHLLTYFNGRCQPFQQLYAGLAGYEELQEGLAVLAEYLCGGLTARRVRTLAARVIAVQAMTRGRPFAETFALLRKKYRFAPQRAFTTTLRVYRGGGFTKDLIYLRGLRDLLDYLAAGHDLEPLYVGKIGLQHLPYIQEMRRRGVIVPPRILPRFWDDPHIRDRLEACRGKSVLDLMEIGA